MPAGHFSNRFFSGVCVIIKGSQHKAALFFATLYFTELFISLGMYVIESVAKTKQNSFMLFAIFKLVLGKKEKYYYCENFLVKNHNV